MAEKLKVGIIGTGGISQSVHIPGFQACEDAEIVAVSDPSAEMLEKVAKDFSLKNQYSDYKEMLEKEQLDAVVIATPNYLHAPIVSDAAAKGLHILCEKPLAMNLKEAEEMCEKVEAAGITNMVAFNYRWCPALKWFKQIIDEGTLGRIYHFRALYLQQWPTFDAIWRTKKEFAGTGQLGDIGSHLIDFAHLLVGNIASVCGLTKIITKERFVPGTSEKFEVDTDDSASFLAEFENGATGLFEVTRFAPGRGCGPNEHQFIEINAEKGSVVYNYQDQDQLKLCLTKEDMEQARFVATKVPDEIKQFYGEAIWQAFVKSPPYGFRHMQAKLFVDAIRAGKQVEPNFQDAVKVQRVLEAVSLADKERRWTKVTEV